MPKQIGHDVAAHPADIPLALQVSWEMAHGEIPAGMEVMHLCDNPPCVRPDHLKLGTHAENMADMVAKGRASNPTLKARRQRS